MSKTTVACVYKTDPEIPFSPDYVWRLADYVKEHTTRPYELVCLTDSDAKMPCATIPLTEGLARQWSKLELFKPHFSGRVVYFDLDTIILKSIDPLMDYDGSIAMAHCWKGGFWGSMIMAWNTDLQCILPTPEERAVIDAGPKRGDQKFIATKLEAAGYDIDRVHDIVKTASYRWHIRHNRVPVDVVIVCFHGSPRPHEIGWTL